jgi:hypothetical protein
MSGRSCKQIGTFGCRPGARPEIMMIPLEWRDNDLGAV